MTWEDAMTLFVDRTGLPGPRSGRVRTFPTGRADHPVTGVSWYEAAAYATFRGKQLPTVFEWEKAARNGAGRAGLNCMPWGVFYPGDTLAHAPTSAPRHRAGRPAEFGMSPFGAYNMAGNVAEWTMNDSSDGFIATGGAWGDPTYTFAQFGGRPGMFSSNKLGFRLVKSDAGQPAIRAARASTSRRRSRRIHASAPRRSERWRRPTATSKTPLDAADRGDHRDARMDAREDHVQRRRRRARDRLSVPAAPRRATAAGASLRAGGGRRRRLPVADRLHGGSHGRSSSRAAPSFAVVLKGYIERLQTARRRSTPRDVEFHGSDRQPDHRSAPRARLPRDAPGPRPVAYRRSSVRAPEPRSA